jgi:enoyl-CoA hydratase/3-hydroxyacyl-CoA dehydrogenase
VKLENITNVAVIGAGNMGHGIAEVALLSGYKVSLHDITQEAVEKGKSLIDWSLKKFVKKELVSEDDYEKFLSNLKTTTSLIEAVTNADLIIEAVPEILGLKKKIFSDLDILSPERSILASNTSTMSITELSAETQRPGKVVGLHFPPPPVLAKMIEIVKGEKTSEDTIRLAVEFTKKALKVPIISKDSPGFICNRIVAPSLLLVQLMLDRNEYPPAKVDAAAMNMGMIMGPYELLDYIGLDVIYHSSKYLAKRLSKDFMAPSKIKKLVDENKLGKKTGEGIYKWPAEGRPTIDRSDPANFDLMDMMRVQINEAAKVLEEGIASAEDIDTGMKLHYNNLWGPFELAKTIDLEELTSFLDSIAVKYGKEIFQAHKWIRDGTLSTKSRY